MRVNAPTTRDRQSFLGGTDAPAVLGVSAWMTPVDLWRLKTGRVKQEPNEQRDRRLARGKKLEPFICDMVVDKLRDEGHDVKLLARNERYTDPEHAFLSVEIDMELLLDGEHVNVDAKSVGGQARHKWGQEGSDEIPIDYAAQFMDGLMITGRERCLAAALRSFDDVDLYWLKRDQETIDGMRAKMVSFWKDHVERDKPPDPVNFADLRSLFAKPEPRRVEATPEILDAVSELGQIKGRVEALTAREEHLRFLIAKHMGPAETLSSGVRDVMSWGNESRVQFELERFKREHPDWYALFTKTTTTRVLRRAKSRSAGTR